MRWKYRGLAFVGVIALASSVVVADAQSVEPQSPSRAGSQSGSAAGWKTIDIQNGVSCGIRLDGSAWCWGDNRAGQVGDGTEIARFSPTRVGDSTAWMSLS